METVTIDKESIVSRATLTTSESLEEVKDAPVPRLNDGEYYVDKVLDEKKLDNGMKMYRVRWQGEESDTWEPESNLISGDGTINAALAAYWNLQRVDNILPTDDEEDNEEDANYVPISTTTSTACGKCDICSRRKKYGGPGLPRELIHRACPESVKANYRKRWLPINRRVRSAQRVVHIHRERNKRIKNY
jgi:hypothetical protein